MSTSRVKNWSTRVLTKASKDSTLMTSHAAYNLKKFRDNSCARNALSDTHLYWCLSWQWHIYFWKFENLKGKRNIQLSRSGEVNVVAQNSFKFSKHIRFVLTNQPVARRGLLSTSGRVPDALQLAISELPSASVSKRVFAQNPKTRFDTEKEDNSELVHSSLAFPGNGFYCLGIWRGTTQGFFSQA